MSTLWTGAADENEHYYWEDRSVESRELEITEHTTAIFDATFGSIITTGVGIGVTVGAFIAWSIWK